MAQFKNWVQTCGQVNPEEYDDYDYLRFCRARKFVIDDVMLMFQNFVNWRKEQCVDDIIETYDFHEF